MLFLHLDLLLSENHAESSTSDLTVGDIPPRTPTNGPPNRHLTEITQF